MALRPWEGIVFLEKFNSNLKKQEEVVVGFPTVNSCRPFSTAPHRAWHSNLQSCSSNNKGDLQTPHSAPLTLERNERRERNLGLRSRRSMDCRSNGAGDNATAAASWDERAMERVLWSPEHLDKRVEELANAISEDFSGQALAVVGVATGAFVFLADLVRKLKVPVAVDLIRVQSYGAKTKSSGVANLMTDIRIDVKGKHVLLVEDIIDTGITLSTLVAHFEAKGVASISVCALLDKVSRRVVPLDLAEGGKYYRGFECPDEFVVGYGMDYAEEYRNLPYVGILKREIYIKTTAEK